MQRIAGLDAVLERRGDQIHFNPRLLELAAHYHFVPRPCQVRAGNQKGRVERAIRYVRDSFWAGRVFPTLAECNRRALVWRDEVAHQRRWPDDSAHRSLERRLRLSEIKKFRPMADFNWSWPTRIERDVIERALTLDFLPEARLS